ncbi:MAG: GH39 family glycosyl hydrolase [Candidatus Xenobia bacterium]
MKTRIAALLLLLLCASPLAAKPIHVDYQATGRPFPHFWETTFGSGRAILSLRDSWRQDARAVKAVTDFQYVRFHAIFHDEVGLYHEIDGKPVFNFSYVDQIYDGLRALGLRPYVEMSFTPKDLAGPNPTIHTFWYHPIVSPPKDWQKWETLVETFARHLVARYGIDEVSKWPFEVWNEPNLDFWAGDPKEATYYELYDHAARAIKRVSPRLQVGGPSTAQASWVDRFLAHCVQNQVPVDFVSTHVYANDPPQPVLGVPGPVSRETMVARAVRKVHDQVKASARPDLPIYFSEFNASYMNEPNVTDSAFMGPWMASTIRQCDGLVTAMSYWTFSDVFEEGGVVKTPFYGGFGLLAEFGIPKPACDAFALLHRLGTTRLPVDADDALVTRTKHGAAIALWNYTDPGVSGPDKTFDVPLGPFHQATLWRVDETHGNAVPLWKTMGAPATPTPEQVKLLRRAARLSPTRTRPGPVLHVTVPYHGLVLLELQ